MKALKLFGLMAIVAAFVTGCGGDPEDLMVSSIVADGTSFENGEAVTVDLNSATTAIDVPINDLTITATFDKAVDAATVSESSVSLTSAAGDVVGASVAASGSSITLTADGTLVKGTSYSLSISGVAADDEGMLPAVTRSFTTEGRAPVVPPNVESQMAYWSFDGNTNDQLGNFSTTKVVAIDYGEDRFGLGGSTAVFDGDASIIEIADADRFMEGSSLTLSFWMKTNSDEHINGNGDPASYFVLGLAAFKGFQFEVPADFSSCKLAMHYEQEDGMKRPQELWFPGTPLTIDSWMGWTFHADLTAVGGVEAKLRDRWVHIVLSYDAESKIGSMYFDGELMKSQDFNLYGDDHPLFPTVGVGYNGEAPSELPELAFGFIHSSGGTLWDNTPWGNYDDPGANHYKGDLDDIRIFDTSFTAADVKNLYDAEK